MVAAEEGHSSVAIIKYKHGLVTGNGHHPGLDLCRCADQQLSLGQKMHSVERVETRQATAFSIFLD